MELLKRPYQDIVALAGPAGATTICIAIATARDAWLAQLVGASGGRCFHPRLFVAGSARQSPAPGLRQYRGSGLRELPGFRNAHADRRGVHPGEMILVPSGWLHQVVSLDPRRFALGKLGEPRDIGVFLRGCRRAQLDQARNVRVAPAPLVDAMMRPSRTLIGRRGDDLTRPGGPTSPGGIAPSA